MSSVKKAGGLKATAITVAVLGYLGLATVGTFAGSSAIVDVFHKRLPTEVSLTGGIDYWRSSASAGNPRERKIVKAAFALPAIAFLMGGIACLASFGPRRRDLHGAARFANRAEITKAGLLTNKGILLGEVVGGYLTLPGNQSVLLSAPTRSGKGVGVVIPNLLTWPDSVCVLDIKGENFAITAGFREKHGQQVFGWAPFARDGRSHGWNPLSYVRANERHVVGDILTIGQAIYPTESRGPGSDAFFNDQARNLFLGLALYLVETPELPRTIGEILRQSSGKGLPIKDHLQEILETRQAEDSDRPLSGVCVDALSRFMSTSENTLTSILATLNAPLTVFADPFVDAATSRDDFSVADVRKQRMSIYLCIPPNRLADASVLLNLFFSQLVNLNTEELPEQNPALKYQCLLVNDEFTSMGRVGVFAKAIGYLAGYNLRVLTVIQAVSQLDAVYGDKDARTFGTQHAAMVLFAPREQRDANEYSEMLGTFTEKSESQGRSVNGGQRGGTSRSTNVSDQRRALLLPQEFKELGVDHEVVVVENVKPILATKIRYYADPTFKDRVLPPPTLPEIDLDVHRARVRQQVRAAQPGEDVSAGRLAISFAGLPKLTSDSSPEMVSAFAETFLGSLIVQPMPSTSSRSDQPAYIDHNNHNDHNEIEVLE